jgi:glycosyltransferase involved in cell wall biosynthesis
MKKVLHIRSSFDPGGTETLLLNLFNFRQDRFKIHFALLRDGSLIERLDENGGNKYYRWFRRRFLDLNVLRKLYRLARQENIRLVHTHQFIELCYAVCLKLLIPRMRIIHQVHLMFARKNLAFYLERLLSRQFAGVVTVSKAARAEMVGKFGYSEDKIAVLYNAVAVNGVDGLSREAVNAKLKVPLRTERFNAVMIANFVWGKDHETIFKAYNAHIREQLPEVAFYFIGRESEISERLAATYLTGEDRADGRVVLCGPIPDAHTLLPAFDLVVMSCFSETFNIALVEAAASGKPILASDIPVFRELSEEGRYFQHFKTRDPEDFFRKLEQIIHQPDNSNSSDIVEHFKEKFGFPSFIEGLADIYEETLRACLDFHD